MVLPYNKILVPYDGSEPSERALEQATQLVNALITCGSKTSNSTQETQMILLHVVEKIRIPLPTFYISLRILAGKPLKEFFNDVYEELREVALSMLDDKKKRIESNIKVVRENKGTEASSISVTVITQVAVGNAAEVILDIANNKEKVDLIIMGSTGLKGISKVRVLGSVSRQVCENANCSVMLVH